MDYTAEQYEMLERFEAGANINTFTENEKVIFWFLDDNKLLQAHADIEDGLFDLSQQGKCVLEAHRKKLLKAKQDTNQSAKKESSKKQEHIKERLFQVFLVLLGFLLGLVGDHISEILNFFSETVKPWFCSLFH